MFVPMTHAKIATFSSIASQYVKSVIFSVISILQYFNVMNYVRNARVIEFLTNYVFFNSSLLNLVAKIEHDQNVILTG